MQLISPNPPVDIRVLHAWTPLWASAPQPDEDDVEDEDDEEDDEEGEEDDDEDEEDDEEE